MFYYQVTPQQQAVSASVFTLVYIVVIVVIMALPCLSRSPEEGAEKS
ncbi:MAG: hypothetical protein ACLR2E_07415 [Lachnospiraceae bacterium]